MVSRARSIRDLFTGQKAYDSFTMFAKELRNNGNKMTVHHASEFASKLAAERVYNKANFYWYVIGPLVDLGFLNKIPTWNNILKRTQYCYVPLRFDIPRHPLSHGYYRDAWYVCQEWNDLFFGSVASRDAETVSLNVVG
ncbi:MAG: hypothetical protein ACREBQ_10540 [Nitrososphaerales archaeon]